MDLRLTEDQAAMAEVTSRFLADHCPPEALRRWQGFDAARWAALSELGLAGMLVPEPQGGLGLTPADLLPIAEACGAALLPEPLLAQIGVIQPLLAEAGAGEALARALDGAVIALAHPLDPMPNLAEAAEAALIPRADGLWLVEAADLQIAPQPSIDPLRRPATLTAPEGTGTRLTDAATAESLLTNAAQRAALFTAAELLGIAQSALRLACAYASERAQFGRAIGTNQAVKHRLADAEIARSFAAPVVAAAAHACPAHGPVEAARLAHASHAAAKAADSATHACLQTHGAMGYSWEVDAHFYLKRALALTPLWGARRTEALATRLQAAPLTPDHLFGDPNA